MYIWKIANAILFLAAGMFTCCEAVQYEVDLKLIKLFY